jgi:hypothetical protein
MKRLRTLLVIVLLITSCATQEQQAKTEGTGIGALLGGAVGAAIGGIAGRDARSALIGAGVGAALGGVAGYAYADNIARRRQELVGKENDVDARIAFARGVNEDTQEYNRKLSGDLKTLRSDIDKLTAQNKSQESQNQDLIAKKERLEQTVKDADSQLAVADEQLQELKTFRSNQGKSSKELDGEIKKLETNLAQLKSNTSALAALNQRI